MDCDSEPEPWNATHESDHALGDGRHTFKEILFELNCTKARDVLKKHVAAFHRRIFEIPQRHGMIFGQDLIAPPLGQFESYALRCQRRDYLPACVRRCTAKEMLADDVGVGDFNLMK